MDTTLNAHSLQGASVLFLTGGLAAAGAAWLHMRELALAYGVICGAGPGLLAHCPACAISASLFAAGAATLVLARPQPTPVSIKP